MKSVYYALILSEQGGFVNKKFEHFLSYCT